jgi:hypothetical protein
MAAGKAAIVSFHRPRRPIPLNETVEKREIGRRSGVSFSRDFNQLESSPDPSLRA